MDRSRCRGADEQSIQDRRQAASPATGGRRLSPSVTAGWGEVAAAGRGEVATVAAVAAVAAVAEVAELQDGVGGRLAVGRAGDDRHLAALGDVVALLGVTGDGVRV